MFECKKCNKRWEKPFKECIYCGGSISEENPQEAIVLGSTKVLLDSKTNKAPYTILLVEADGWRGLVQNSKEVNIGTKINFESQQKDGILGVIGSGKMGLGLAIFLLENGYRVILKTRNLDKKGEIETEVSKNLKKSNDDGAVLRKMAQLTISDSFADLKGCKLVIECVSENEGVKKEVLDEVAKATDAIIASNTSAIPISRIAPAGAENRTIGLHFFNPIKKMRLVEIVDSGKVPKRVLDEARQFCASIDKKAILVKDTPGFIVNRLMMAQLNEAKKMVAEGVAQEEEIDEAMRLGLNHPMGPFQLIKLIGPGVVDGINKILEKSQKK